MTYEQNLARQAAQDRKQEVSRSMVRARILTNGQPDTLPLPGYRCAALPGLIAWRLRAGDAWQITQESSGGLVGRCKTLAPVRVYMARLARISRIGGLDWTQDMQAGHIAEGERLRHCHATRYARGEEDAAEMVLDRRELLALETA